LNDSNFCDRGAFPFISKITSFELINGRIYAVLAHFFTYILILHIGNLDIFAIFEG